MTWSDNYYCSLKDFQPLNMRKYKKNVQLCIDVYHLFVPAIVTENRTVHYACNNMGGSRGGGGGQGVLTPPLPPEKSHIGFPGILIRIP